MTLFKSIYDNKTDKRMDFSNWQQFEKLLYDLSKIERKTKKEAQLISPATYQTDTTRANKNVIEWARWAAVDVDSHNFEGNLENELFNRYGHWNYVCYSTASSTSAQPKFRIIFPLARSVQCDQIRQFWYALNAELDTIGDRQCKDLSRMYYIPAKYAGANNFIFSNHSGSVIAPDILIAKHPVASTMQLSRNFIDRLPDDIQKQVVKHRMEAMDKTGITWSTYQDCPFINKTLVNEYKSITNGGWYITMYRIMVSIAANAIHKGYPISSYEIAAICRELDLETGNWYQGRPLEVEADRAIEFAYKNM